MSVESDKKNDTSMPFGDLTPHNMTCPSFTAKATTPSTYVESSPVSKTSYSHQELDSATYGTLVGPV